MDILKELSPEQIKALTPECLQVILKQDNKTEDIANLKYYFASLEYESNGTFRSSNNKSKIAEIQKLLLKYTNNTFYLTFRFLNDKYNDTDWKIYTEEEIKIIIPTGVELHKICFFKDNFPLQQSDSYSSYGKHYEWFMHYPHHRKDEKNEVNYIAQLINYHNNLKIVHPCLLKCAEHFCS